MKRTDIPAWIEDFRPDDGLYADAYEETPPQRRALLKTAAAFLFARYGMRDGECGLSSSSRRKGFSYGTDSRPAAWVLAVAGPGYASPARLIANLVPAVLAGVENIIIVSESPFSSASCAAFELSGLEDSFVMPGGRIAALFHELSALDPDGRLAVFPGADGRMTPAQQELMHAAARSGLPRLRDKSAPRILLRSSCSEREESLLWLHPDAEIIRSPKPGTALELADDPVSASGCARLSAGPGMDACWTGPSPDFFRTETCSAFLMMEDGI